MDPTARKPPPSLPEALVRQLTPLREQLHGARPNAVVPFVGSGLSRGLKSWRELLEDLVELLPEVDQRDARMSLEQGRYLDLADFLATSREVGPSRIQQAITDAYRRPTVTPPSTYDAVAGLPTRHFLTTNYDPWLKDAVGRRLGGAVNVLLPRDER